MKKLKQPEIFYTEQIGINAKFFGKKPAVICGEERQSWEDFHRRTNMVANALLGLGLKKGDKVALLMQNSVAMFELIWGTIKAGGVTVPINVMLAQDSLGIMINNSEAKWVFADPVTAPQIEPIKGQLTNVLADGFYAIGGLGGMWRAAEALVDGGSPKDPKVKLKMSDSMNIIYSSGTTGLPKGIEQPFRAAHVFVRRGPGAPHRPLDSVAVRHAALYQRHLDQYAAHRLCRRDDRVAEEVQRGEFFPDGRARKMHTCLHGAHSVHRAA